MQLDVTPRDALADEGVTIRVTGAPAGSKVTLTARMVDANGRRWASRCVYGADPSGAVDVTQQAPLSGSYTSVDPVGLIWSMRCVHTDGPFSMFLAPAGPLEITFAAQVAGAEPVTAAVIRRWRAAPVTRADIRQEGVIGTLFEPPDAGPHPAVAVFPGSTGLGALEPTAALLASHGYSALVIGYYGLAGLPATLCEIPLVRLADGVRWLQTHPTVDGTRVGALGASVGAEGLLAAAAAVPLDLRALVALAPSSVVWQARGAGRPPRKSSWTHAGRPLPFALVRGERLLPQVIAHALARVVARQARPTPLHLLPAYAAGLRDQRAAHRAAIPVERIAAPLLLISGQDDQVWPAGAMADAIVARRSAMGRVQGDRHVSYADAGHIIRPPIGATTVLWTERLFSGGTPVGQAAAQAGTWQQIVQFLSDHLG